MASTKVAAIEIDLDVLRNAIARAIYSNGSLPRSKDAYTFEQAAQRATEGWVNAHSKANAVMREVEHTFNITSNR